MKTLELFNAVLFKENEEEPFISEKGYIIEPGALWAKKQIVHFYRMNKLDGYGLNATFHKSWKKILTHSRRQLLVEQVRHYASTYGSSFTADIYIPNELVGIPKLELKYRVVRSYTREVLIEKCLGLLRSGAALKEETINDVLTILVKELSYTFTGGENIKNKEAIVKIADLYGVFPKDSIAFFRYILYRTTGQGLLIKNENLIEGIKNSSYNPANEFIKFGLEKLAEIFNRFKPLFLAYKTKCSKVINKISKLSKVYHKPMRQNPLNHVTTKVLSDSDLSWLDRATPYALFRSLFACYSRVQGQYAFLYRVRNGKSFTKKGMVSGVVWPNYTFLMNYCRARFDLRGKTFFLPKGIEFALPTSEKLFVSSIPTGTSFYGDALAVGVYWKNSWGARDLDLSGLNISGKVGWNATYNQGEGSLMYSGDITDAPNGAVEYLYAQNSLKVPTLVLNNVYSGEKRCAFKIIVGAGDHIDEHYMMNPNKLIVETMVNSVSKKTVLGMFLPAKKGQRFVLLNFGAGANRVSDSSVQSEVATQALFQKWSNPISFRDIIVEFGGQIVKKAEQATYNFSLDNLEIDSFIKVFEHSK